MKGRKSMYEHSFASILLLLLCIFHELNMSSPSSESEQSSDSVRQGLHMDSGDEDVLVVNLVVNPCESEPLVNA